MFSVVNIRTLVKSMGGRRGGQYNLPRPGGLAKRNQEGRNKMSVPTRMAAIFVDRSSPEHWIVRDPEGNFWIVPPIENAWESRQPFQPTAETELESIPGHYGSMIGLPF